MPSVSTAPYATRGEPPNLLDGYSAATRPALSPYAWVSKPRYTSSVNSSGSVAGSSGTVAAVSRPSSRVLPQITGTRAILPWASASAGCCGRTRLPNSIGVGPRSMAVKAAAGSLRRHSAVEQPSWVPRAAPSASAFAFATQGEDAGKPLITALSGQVIEQPPLCAIARWNKPREPGATRWAHTSKAPPDSPKTVTSPGSPPNAAALRWTQRSAACWSSRPNAPEPGRSGWARKPKKPSRKFVVTTTTPPWVASRFASKPSAER